MASNPFDALATSSAPNPFDKPVQMKNPFDPVGAVKGLGSAALDLMSRPGKGTEAALTRGPRAGLAAFMHGESPEQLQSDRDQIKRTLHVKDLIDKLPAGLARGTADTTIDMALDPTTYAGGLGIFEKGANLLGRAATIGGARGIEGLGKVAPKAAEAVGSTADFFAPGGSKMGALKRNLAAKEGGAGLDKYAVIRQAKKVAESQGGDVGDAVAKALGIKPKATADQVRRYLEKKTGAPAVSQVPQKLGPAMISAEESFGKSRPLQFQPARPQNWPLGERAGNGVKLPKAQLPPEIAAALAKGEPDIISRLGNTTLGKGAKGLTRGTTSLMFATPQLPGMEGHGSNVLQTAFFSDPVTALKSLGSFAGSGEAIPFSGIRNAVQKLPGVHGLKAKNAEQIERAKGTGAITDNADFGAGHPGFLDKIPVVGAMARESNRGLGAWDQVVKGKLNDHWYNVYKKQGASDAVARAKAAERVGQDVVDYSDVSDFTRASRFAQPFATYASKKPGIIARAAARHPERVLALTRNNPNFQDQQSTEGFDKGRPLTSIFNALNNRSPAAKGGAPFPGAQYVRASSGALLDDLLGAANPYFTYGPPAKHAGGDALKGWLKLLLTQTAGNIAPPVGEDVLNKLGYGYFGK